ncbi:hypothetical protein [Paenibacillus sanguinis]|uniref:hypothetical protein n=1 Tax=Paenibacillus sanguinis TaxID=225906 RepID=UPI00037D9F96|nr:hypothetical protein [Paenibacillus sanguinis]
MSKQLIWGRTALTAVMGLALLWSPISAGVTAAAPLSINSNSYKAFHDTYDEQDPDQKFLHALDTSFYNVELDIMVDSSHSTYSGSQYPDYLQGQVKLYVKHDAAAQPNTRNLYQYFEEVVAQIERNGGSLHGDGQSIVINLDMKPANNPDYVQIARSLQAMLEHYGALMTFGNVGDAGSFTERAITVCLSGSEGLKSAYFDYISGTTGKLLAFKDEVYSLTDGRRENPADYFPNDADIYHRFYAIHWKHIESGFDLLTPGNWAQDEEERLEEMLRIATDKGYTLRFYSLNGNEGAWHYKFPGGDGDAAQRWTQFAYMNHKLGTRHFVSTDSYEAITKVFDRFLVPLRDYNHRVEKAGGTQSGTDVSVSLTSDNRVVEVHKAEGLLNNNLWYSVGSIQDDGYIQWLTNKRIDPNGSSKNGIQPHSGVTEVNGQHIVVQVNQTDGNGSGLWANIGRLEADSTITWMTNERIAIGGQHTQGSWPHVAIDGDRIVLVYLNGGKLQYQAGLINSDNYQIAWNQTGTILDQSAERPDVAFQNDQLVVVYQNNGRLNYTLGAWNEDGSITWGTTGDMQGQNGNDPTVAFVGNDKVIELHTSETTGLIWYNIGEIRGNAIDWVHNYIWDSGSSSKPSVDYDASSNTLIELHKAGTNDALWYNSGKIHLP